MDKEYFDSMDGIQDEPKKRRRIASAVQVEIPQFDENDDDDDNENDDDNEDLDTVIENDDDLLDEKPGKRRRRRSHGPGEDDKLTLQKLNKRNIWTLDEEELYHLLMDGRHKDDSRENEVHYMNIIRPVFNLEYLDRSDEMKVRELEAQKYFIFSTPTNGNNNAIAIRKRPIKKITDLTLENIFHIEPHEVLKLIENNLGTGWQGLPLAIQDIIEAGFYVDCSVMPAASMHRAGGIIDRRRADGYEVLEVERGSWIEGVFIKVKPRMEKRHFESVSEKVKKAKDSDEDDGSDDDNDIMDDKDDRTPAQVENDENDMDDDVVDEENPEIEEIDVVDGDDEDDDEE